VGHAHHFLGRLDRVTREQTEFALGLYRDSDAVRFVLDHVRLPEDAPRVALAIEDAREGPFVIVTRDGRFVTCLGRGMRQNHPTVPRAQVDALLAKVIEKRARREIAQRELRPDEEEGELFQRIFSRGKRFSREDYLAVSGFEAMFGMTPYMLMLEIGLDVVRMREAMARGAHRVTQIRQTTRKALERQDRLMWGTAHLMLLCGAGERRDREEILGHRRPEMGSPTLPCAAHSGLTFLFRAAWAAARFGKVMIPAYKHGLSVAPDWLQAIDAGLGLGAIALRHTGAWAEVRRFFQTMVARGEGQPQESNEALRGRVGKAVLETLDAAEERTETSRRIGSEFCVTLGSALPEGHPLRRDARQLAPRRPPSAVHRHLAGARAPRAHRAARVRR
jgi:hypothetical protein